MKNTNQSLANRILLPFARGGQGGSRTTHLNLHNTRCSQRKLAMFYPLSSILYPRCATSIGRARRLTLSAPHTGSGRRGATLMEVLIAVMITSIGLVAIMSMFPLSVLRSVRATQITSSTTARLNVETMMDVYQNMIKNPVSYATDGTDSKSDPPVNGFGLTTYTYVIDPVGFNVVQGLGLTIGSSANKYENQPEHYFGNNPGSLPWSSTPPGTPWLTVPRYPLTWRSLAAADSVVTLPDSWMLQFEANGQNPQTDAKAAAGPTQIDVPGLGASGFALPTYPSARVVIFSPDGGASQTRIITKVSGDTVSWTENATGVDANGNNIMDDYPLPTGFLNLFVTDSKGVKNNVSGNVRVEIQERRYTWLLTVRQQASGLSSDIDVVVFFNRPFESIADDEVLYPAQFNLSSTQAKVSYQQANKPFLRKGNFVFDANNAYWYRISNVQPDLPTAQPGVLQANITLEMPANAASPVVNNVLQGKAMFPRAVVDVFPIGSKAFR